MQRRKFLLATASTIPALAFGQKVSTKTDRTTKGFVIKATESRFKEKTFVGGANDIKVSSKDTNGELSIFEFSGVVKGGPPLHIHLFQDEIFFVIAGEYLFQVGGEQHKLTSGDTIFLPRNVPHTFAQLTDKGKLFYQFQPSGKMEDFFRALSGLNGQPTPEEAAKLFSNHDMKIVGPPLQF